MSHRDHHSNYRDDGAPLDRNGNELHVGPSGHEQRHPGHFEYRGDNPITEEIRRVYEQAVHARHETERAAEWQRLRANDGVETGDDACS